MYSLFLFYTPGRWFVDDRPENAEFLDRIHELVKIHWLDHVGVDPELIARHHVPFFPRRSEHDYGNHPQAVVRLDLLQDLQAIDLGEFKVQQ